MPPHPDGVLALGRPTRGGLPCRVPSTPAARRALVAVAFTAVAALGLAGGTVLARRSADAPAVAAPPDPAPTAASPAPPGSTPTPPGSTPTQPGAGVPVRLAFAGDVHFAGTSAAALTSGLGTGAQPLRTADLAVVNLETAVTGGGDPAPGKEFVFAAPPSSLTVLRDAGVDAVSLANNHGMDHGLSGLRDSLAASTSARLPLLGAGADSAAAWAPLRRTVRGVRVSVIAATDVLDDDLRDLWTAGPAKPGLASAKDGTAFADALRAERPQTDVLVAFLHWGVEKQSCPSTRQRELARALVDAGADVVVGSHAHVLQPVTSLRAPGPGGERSAVVAYGLGNFVFYGTTEAATRTGVLTVTATAVPGGGPGAPRTVEPAWTGARIVSGRPRAVPPARQAAVQPPPIESCG